MCTTDFIQSICGVGSAARIVEPQRLQHCLATIVISQIELTKQRRRVGDSANTHVTGVNIQPVCDVPSEHERIVILLLNVTRYVQYEHYIHPLAATCNAKNANIKPHNPLRSKTTHKKIVQAHTTHTLKEKVKLFQLARLISHLTSK